MKPKIIAYCMDWHITNSDAFRDMLTEPLKKYFNIELTAWDGEHLPANAHQGSGSVVFCMLPPPIEFVQKTQQSVIWLPMWDQVQGYDQQWWNDLPKEIKVVSFSNPVTKFATAAGLEVLNLRYYKNPSEYKQVNWENGNKIFYWNRTGMIGPVFLENLCRVSRANELLFLGKIDPRIDKKMSYTLPGKFGDCAVKNLRPTEREKFLKAVEPANIFIAPRIAEGVGMTFLEAMARGCAVLAYDAPTMNEYIQDGFNGLLFHNRKTSLYRKLKNRFRSPFHSLATPYLLGEDQNWKSLKEIDFQALGNHARDSHIQGYQKWQDQISDYANFVSK